MTSPAPRDPVISRHAVGPSAMSTRHKQCVSTVRVARLAALPAAQKSGTPTASNKDSAPRVPLAVLKVAFARPWIREAEGGPQVNLTVLGRLRDVLEYKLGADKQQLGKVFSRQRAKLLSTLTAEGLGPKLELWTEVIGKDYSRMFLEAEPTLILLHPLTLLGSLEGVSQSLRLPPRRSVEYLMKNQFLVGVTAASIQLSVDKLQSLLGAHPEDIVTMCVQWGQLLYLKPEVLEKKVATLLEIFAEAEQQQHPQHPQQQHGPTPSPRTPGHELNVARHSERDGMPSVDDTASPVWPNDAASFNSAYLSTTNAVASSAEPQQSNSSSIRNAMLGSSREQPTSSQELKARSSRPSQSWQQQPQQQHWQHPAAVTSKGRRELSKMVLRRPQILLKSTGSVAQRISLLASTLDLPVSDIKQMVLCQPAILGVDPKKAAARWSKLHSYSERHPSFAAELQVLLPWQKGKALLLQSYDYGRLDWFLEQGLAGTPGSQDLAGVLFYARKFLARYPAYSAASKQRQ